MQRAAAIERRAPYVPASTFKDFLRLARRAAVPDKVDAAYIRRLGIKGSESSLVSTLKFLGVIDQHGFPTHAYVELQGQNWREALRQMVFDVYGPLFDLGGSTMSDDELAQHFASSSDSPPSVSKLEARFFREVRNLCGLGSGPVSSQQPLLQLVAPPEDDFDAEGQLSSTRLHGTSGVRNAGPTQESMAQAKARVVEALAPGERPDWSPADYLAVYDKITEVVRTLD